MIDKEVKKFWDDRFSKIDLKQMIKDTYFGGFDNYEDYVKYGDLFIYLEFKDTP